MERIEINTTYQHDGHRFSKRSCLNCLSFDWCICGKNRGASLHGDYAKYSCLGYNGPYSDERPTAVADAAKEKRKAQYQEKKRLKQQ